MHRPITTWFFIIALFVTVAGAMSQTTPPSNEEPDVDWSFKSERAIKARQRFDKAILEQRLVFEKASTEAGKQLLADLEEAQTTATKSGDLDDAVKIRNAITKFGFRRFCGTSWG